MPHKLSIVPNDLEKVSTTFKCENCGRSLSVMKEDSGSSPFFKIGKDGQPQLTGIRSDHEGKAVYFLDSVERYIGDCTK